MSGLRAGCPGWRAELLWSLVRGAGFPSWGPDVRGFATGRISGLAWVLQLHLVMEGPDFRVKGRMSGTSGGAGCPG